MKRQISITNLWTGFLERSFTILVPVVAILAAFLVSGLLIVAWGANPVAAYKAVFEGAFGSLNAVATTLTRLSPLAFTGLAVAYGYRSGFFNVGAEGQLFLGALAATWVGVTFTDLPGWLLIILCMLAAAIAGGALALLPGYLKAWRGFNEVLVTLLLNYVVIQFFEWSLRVDHPTRGVDMKWTLVNWLGIKDPTQPYPKSATLPEAAWLPSLGSIFRGDLFSQLFSGTSWSQGLLNDPAVNRITLAPVLVIMAIIVVYIIMFKTTIGYRARAVGVNPEAARFMGIDVRKTIITTSIISGMLAGMGGYIEVVGAQHRVIEKFLVDAGFTGIPVALIGQLHPYGVGLSALFFGALRAGANRMQIVTAVPIAMIYVIQALAILFAISGTTVDLVSYWKKKKLAVLSERAEEIGVEAKEVSNV